MLLTLVLLGFLLLAIILLFIITSEFLTYVRTRVPFVPTHKSDIEFFVKQLGITSSHNFYDLGSGNGKVVFLVEELSGGAKGTGFELSWWTVIYSKLKARLKGSRAKFINKNFFHEDWSEAHFIYAYLFPPLMGRVEEQFKANCKPGTIAIVRDFPFPNMMPHRMYSLPKEHEIYIYKL